MPSSDKPIPELKVLRRKASNLADENDWPQFDVLDAEVRDGNGKLTSLFLASPDNQMALIGQLVTKRANPHVLPTHKGKARIPIAVNNITHFAFGVFDSGAYAIWAAGEAGWYTIQPSKAYENVFKEMVEALDVLYFLVEAHEGPNRPTYTDLFRSYAKAKDIAEIEAMRKIYSHKAFLASRMVKGEEGIKWGQTSFYQHLRKSWPDCFPQRSNAATAPSKKQSSTASMKTSVPQTRTAAARVQISEKSSRSHSNDLRTNRVDPAKENISAAASTKRVTRSNEALKLAQQQQALARQFRPRNLSQQNQIESPLLSEMNKARAREVWKFMQRKSNETLPEIAEMTIETFARFLLQEYEFQDEKEAQYFLKFLAPDLAGMMSIRRNRTYDPWTELPVYDELIEAKLPPRIKSRIACLKLQKRHTPLPDQDDETDVSDESSSEESVIDKEEARDRKREAARRRISALRPKSGGQYSGKAAKRKGKEKATSTGDEEEEMLGGNEYIDEDAMDVDTPSKRKSLSEDEDDDEEPEYPNKRFTRSQGTLDPELEDLEFAIQQARSTAIPIRRKLSRPTEPPSRDGDTNHRSQDIILVSEPVHSTDANAPGDVWSCPYAGCMHKVYGASEYENKDLIREHLLDHKERDRVDVIRDEETMTRLPVNHLLKRIRELAERSGGEQIMPLDGGLMGLFPPSLKRQLV
ncbi:uncharacterized protein PV09_05129 [Verruconis gallopava]|uniref:DNA (cytosine-5)-methyltransferase 1 replication foci domain-containing protein n=1 Tax=Verruconis gallopava TaxID=253628 RepID=A0A0D2AB54_9PEZI|nr:uncharacterized protein PV09_05129 [Verruconis gallopava]KIW03830.1 hypothetical protein PV09_05129 [Verruconis gallopava]